MHSVAYLNLGTQVSDAWSSVISVFLIFFIEVQWKYGKVDISLSVQLHELLQRKPPSQERTLLPFMFMGKQ